MKPSKQVRKTEATQEGETALGRYDVDREARRADGVREKVAKLRAKGRDGEADDAAKRGERRLAGALSMEVRAAEQRGASVPEPQSLVKCSWTVQLVDVPTGPGSLERAPAYVVRFDGQSPIARLKRAGMLSEPQWRAAEKYAGLWWASMKLPRVTAAYDGMPRGGGAAPVGWIDTKRSAWSKLEAANARLLNVEQVAVSEVVVYETTIEALAKRPGLVRMRKLEKAQGAVTQLLSGGLTRLSAFWGLDVGAPLGVQE